MKNLLAEMARSGIRVQDIQNLLGCTDRTVRNKMDGKTKFSVNEALKIRNALFPGLRVEYLFADEDQKMA